MANGLTVALDELARAIETALRDLFSSDPDPRSSDPSTFPPEARELMIEFIVRLALADGFVSTDEWDALVRLAGPEGERLRSVVERLDRRYALRTAADAASQRAPDVRLVNLDAPQLAADLAGMASGFTVAQRTRVRDAAHRLLAAGAATRAPADTVTLREVVWRAVG